MRLALELKVRRVRTAEGARQYGQPIGSVIRPDLVRGVPRVLGKPKGTPAQREEAARRVRLMRGRPATEAEIDKAVAQVIREGAAPLPPSGGAPPPGWSRRNVMTDSEVRRRNNMLAIIARAQTNGLGTRTPGYSNARSVLMREFGYDETGMNAAARGQVRPPLPPSGGFANASPSKVGQRVVGKDSDPTTKGKRGVVTAVDKYQVTVKFDGEETERTMARGTGVLVDKLPPSSAGKQPTPDQLKKIAKRKAAVKFYAKKAGESDLDAADLAEQYVAFAHAEVAAGRDVPTNLGKSSTPKKADAPKPEAKPPKQVAAFGAKEGEWESAVGLPGEIGIRTGKHFGTVWKEDGGWEWTVEVNETDEDTGDDEPRLVASGGAPSQLEAMKQVEQRMPKVNEHPVIAAARAKMEKDGKDTGGPSFNELAGKKPTSAAQDVFDAMERGESRPKYAARVQALSEEDYAEALRLIGPNTADGRLLHELRTGEAIDPKDKTPVPKPKATPKSKATNGISANPKWTTSQGGIVSVAGGNNRKAKRVWTAPASGDRELFVAELEDGTVVGEVMSFGANPGAVNTSRRFSFSADGRPADEILKEALKRLRGEAGTKPKTTPTLSKQGVLDYLRSIPGATDEMKPGEKPSWSSANAFFNVYDGGDGTFTVDFVPSAANTEKRSAVVRALRDSGWEVELEGGDIPDYVTVGDKAAMAKRKADRQAAIQKSESRTAEQLKRELAQLEEELRDMSEGEGFSLNLSAVPLDKLRRALREAEDREDEYVTVKVPSYSELSMSRAMARQLLGLPQKKSAPFDLEVKDLRLPPSGSAPRRYALAFDVKGIRRVRTPEGAREFGQPIGSVIKPDVTPPIVERPKRETYEEYRARQKADLQRQHDEARKLERERAEMAGEWVENETGKVLTVTRSGHVLSESGMGLAFPDAIVASIRKGGWTKRGEKALDLEDSLQTKAVRRVRTAAGARLYGQPIGSVIVLDANGKPIKRGATAGAGRGAAPEAARERSERQARRVDRDRAGDAASDAKVNEREALAKVNARRRKQGKPPLLSLPKPKDKRPRAQSNKTPTEGDRNKFGKPMAVLNEREERLKSDPEYKARFEKVHSFLTQPIKAPYDQSDPRRQNPEYAEYVADLDRRLAHAMVDPGPLGSTPDGELTPEGYEIVDTLVAEELAMIAEKGVPRDRKVVFAAGVSGAGKTTTLKSEAAGQHLGIQFGEDGPSNYAVANADDFKTRAMPMLPAEYLELGIKPEESSALTHEVSSVANKLFLAELQTAGYNTIVDGTYEGKMPKREAEINAFRQAGFRVNAVLVDGDLETSLQRATQRHTRDGDVTDGIELPPDGGYEGRYIPLGQVVVNEQAPDDRRPQARTMWGAERFKSANAQNFQSSIEAGHFDSWIVFDSHQQPMKSSGDATPPSGAREKQDGPRKASDEKPKVADVRGKKTEDAKDG